MVVIIMSFAILVRVIVVVGAVTLLSMICILCVRAFAIGTSGRHRSEFRRISDGSACGWRRAAVTVGSTIGARESCNDIAVALPVESSFVSSRLARRSVVCWRGHRTHKTSRLFVPAVAKLLSSLNHLRSCLRRVLV
jgi:hypothetical protein